MRENKNHFKINSFALSLALKQKLGAAQKGVRFNKESILGVRNITDKPTETFQDTNVYSCHPPDVKKSFIKGEAPRLLRPNSSDLKPHLRER